MISLSSGGAQPNISQGIIQNLQIPLPPLSVQQEIVGRITHEQSLVDANKELITIFTVKIKQVIDGIWHA